ncbi:hypothetical protein ACPXB3_22150 [Gordonia sp. DT219]|uniref:hypothetical protein n=1 Tax=Gordonia sp. DT219 TaxID=3416658 RepID=UPI003CEEFF52
MRPYQHRPELDEADDQAPSEYLRSALVRGLRKLDPATRLDTLADVRLFGPTFDGGVFERRAADIFIRVQDEVDAAVDDEDRPSVQLGFRSIGRGSVVLHLRPMAPIRSGEDQMVPMPEPSKAELALTRILDLHDALEAGRTEEVAEADRDLATRLRQLVESLDAADAGIELDISDSNGTRRLSRLSAEGRAVARAYFERRPQTSTVVLAGSLRTLSASGHIEVQVGRRVIEVTDVPVEISEDLKAQFNDFVRIRTRRTAEVAPRGKSSKVTYTFLQVVSHDEIVPREELAAF